MSKKASTGKGKPPRKDLKTRAATKKAKSAVKKTSRTTGKKAATAKKPKAPVEKERAVAKRPERTKAAAGLSPSARVSAAHHCVYLPDVSQFPAISTISVRLPSPANFSGPITLARLFGTRGANWPREFRRTPFRPGPPREIGLLEALAWLISSPVLGGPRVVHSIAKGFRNAVSQEQRGLAEELVILRMKLEAGEVTQAEFQRERARIEAAWEEPAEKMARPPKRKRPEED